jgi:hypothetical protein
MWPWKIGDGMEHLQTGAPTSKCQDAKDPKPFWPYVVFFFAFAFVPLLFHFCHILYDSRYGIDHTFVGMHVGMDRKTIVEITPTTRNLVVCNPSMCDYVQPNVACNYKWLPMQLFFKFG